MTQIFNENGDVIPVTLVEVEKCKVTQVKTKEKDGYSAVQIGYDELKKTKKSKKNKPFRYLREFVTEGDDYKEGDEIDLSVFEPGDKVKVSGKSKGKGFQGVVKRWGFAGQSATHGTKHDTRKGGSIGSAYPQRVMKGRKMPGRMGYDRVTVRGLEVIKSDPKEGILALKGALPGRKGALLEIKKV